MRESIREKERKGMLYALIGGIFWGINGTMGAYLFMNKNITANWLVPYRLFFAGLFLLVYTLINREKRIFSVFKDKKAFIHILFFAIFGMLGTQYTYFRTIEYSNSGIATAIQYSNPALILIYVCFREKRKPKIFEFIGLVLAILGVFLLATHGKFGSLVISKETLIWGMMSAVAGAIYTLSPGKLIEKYGIMPIVGWGMLIGGALLAFFTKPWAQGGTKDLTTFFVLTLIVIFGTILSFTLFLSGVNLIGATKASIIVCIEPVVAALTTFLFLGSVFTFTDIVAFILLIGTVLIITIFGKE